MKRLLSFGSSRVDRGGSWASSPSFARVALRDRDPPGIRDGLLGFRLHLGVR